MENAYFKAEMLKPAGLAEQLVSARKNANLTGKTLGHRTGFQPSKISKIELGQQIPSAEDVHAWLTACAATTEQIQNAQTELRMLQSFRSAWSQRSAIPAAGLTDELRLTLADAYQLGYEAALADMRRQLGQLSTDAAASNDE